MSILKKILEEKEYNSLEDITLEISNKIDSARTNLKIIDSYFETTYLSDDIKKEMETNWEIITNAIFEISKNVYDVHSLCNLLFAGDEKILEERLKKCTEASYALSAIKKITKI